MLGGGLADVLLVPVGDDVAVVDAAADGVTVEMPANLDPTRRSGARHARRRRRPTVAARRPPGARRPRPHDPRRRGRRRRPRVHRAGRRVRQGAPAVRPADRHVPGGEAPLRQHGRRHRAGHRPRCGTRPGPPPTGGDQLTLRRGGGRHARRCRPPTCAPTSTSRCTAASASRGSTTPTSTCAGPPRCSRCLDADDGRRRRHRPHPPRRAPRAGRSSCRPRPSRSATRCAAFAERIKDLDADEQRDALIETGYVMPHWPKPYGPRRRRGRAARHRAGVRRRRHQAPAATASPAGSSSRSSSTPPRTRSPAGCRPALRPGGHLVPAVQRARRRLRRRRHQDQGHPGRRRLAGQRPEGVDAAAPTSPAWASPPCAPTPTCRSTTASRRWSSTCTPRASRCGR